MKTGWGAGEYTLVLDTLLVYFDVELLTPVQHLKKGGVMPKFKMLFFALVCFAVLL